MKGIKQFFSNRINPFFAGRFQPLVRRINAVIASTESSIRKKLLYSFLIISVIPLISIGVILYLVTSNQLMDDAKSNLEAIGQKKKENLEEFFEECVKDLNVLSEMALTQYSHALHDLENLRDGMIKQVETYLRNQIKNIQVMADDPTVYRALVAFENAGSTGGSLWRINAEKYGPWMTLHKDTYRFKNIYLVSANGRILYSVEKKSDLGENLKTGSLADSPAGKAFKKGLSAASLQDFENYEPLNNIAAAFVAAPIRSGDRVIGVLMGQIAAEPINEIVQQKSGLGEKTEAYLVGKIGNEMFMRSKRTVTDEDVGDPHPDEFMDKAYAGITGTETEFDENGIYKLVSYTALNIPGVKWAIDITTPIEDVFTLKHEGADSDWLTYFAENEDFMNFSIISPEGYIFYSVQHNDDYHTNIQSGPYKDTHLGELINQTTFTRKPLMADFLRYKPTNDLPAGFTAWPVTINDELIFTVVAQLPTEELQEIVEDVKGMGETGETYLVGRDNMWRTDSRFLNEINVDSTVLNSRFKVDSDLVNKIISGPSNKDEDFEKFEEFEEFEEEFKESEKSMGLEIEEEEEESEKVYDFKEQIYTNYRDRNVLSVSSVITLQEPSTYNPNGVKWAMFSEMELSEIQAPVYRMAYIFAGV
ncbi:MAG: cache domain-containing protein, partial [Desulfobacteraceae bacterium]